MLNLLKYNKHWEEGFEYEFDKQRDLFEKIVKLSSKKQIIAITGMRRTGKTVLMKQLINHLIKNRVDRKSILYFSFDEDKLHIDKLLEEYSSVTDVDINKSKIYLFLDEVQKIDNWQEQIKVYYDNYPNLKIFVSGSASLFKKSTESLAGRIFTLELPILSFTEFLRFRGKEDLLKSPKMFPDAIKKELKIYLSRNFIEIIDEDEETATEYIESIINKVAYEDIPSIFPVENPDKLKAIVKAIYSNPGMIITYDSLGNDIGLSSKTVEKYIYYLIQAKIVKKVYNFSRNFLTSEKKLKKFYVTAPCFCFLNDEFDFSKIVENLIALDAKFFWRDAFKNEVDFIFKKDGKILPVEVKFRQEIRKEDREGIDKFMKKFGVREGIIITKDTESKGDVQLIPLWKWLLNLNNARSN